MTIHTYPCWDMSTVSIPSQISLDYGSSPRPQEAALNSLTQERITSMALGHLLCHCFTLLTFVHFCLGHPNSFLTFSMLLMSDPVQVLAQSRRLTNICYLTCWARKQKSVQDERTIEVLKKK